MYTKRSLLASVITGAVAIVVNVPSLRAQPSSISPTGQYLEGSWIGASTSNVNVASGQPPSTQPFYTTFHRDGTLLFIASTPSQSVGTGEWVRVGDRQFAYTHVRFTFDENRKLAGAIKVRAIFQLHETLQTLSGQLKADILDTSGNLVRSVEGSFQAKRMSVEAM